MRERIKESINQSVNVPAHWSEVKGSLTKRPSTAEIQCFSVRQIHSLEIETTKFNQDICLLENQA
jgi:hypothetical protein